jgi:hypothetical protein
MTASNLERLLGSRRQSVVTGVCVVAVLAGLLIWWVNGRINTQSTVHVLGSAYIKTQHCDDTVPRFTELRLVPGAPRFERTPLYEYIHSAYPPDVMYEFDGRRCVAILGAKDFGG